MTDDYNFLQITYIIFWKIFFEPSYPSYIHISSYVIIKKGDYNEEAIIIVYLILSSCSKKEEICFFKHRNKNNTSI